ncbi:hypothetical protein E2C01_084854 [Portunus trituberculatus]|uniref:Uncharacterized protein n=1 Tax=Portunus trituberculatus TaxID=210409 RepID=A0A5B7IWF3_PORTR|nr:hypothetical protein [Portunus trituberculatus]
MSHLTQFLSGFASLTTTTLTARTHSIGLWVKAWQRGSSHLNFMPPIHSSAPLLLSFSHFRNFSDTVPKED